jgi:hypothetical protein
MLIACIVTGIRVRAYVRTITIVQEALPTTFSYKHCSF